MFQWFRENSETMRQIADFAAPHQGISKQAVFENHWRTG